MRNNVFIDGYSYSVKANFSYDKIPLSGCYRKGYFIIGFSRWSVRVLHRPLALVWSCVCLIGS
ncbi:hypothetical protein [Sporomusa rhizae]|uniref:hypothetical protein n=1 Tax=Sporomusa rhizae TaxID=357999 RepID=UPI00352A7354